MSKPATFICGILGHKMAPRFDKAPLNVEITRDIFTDGEWRRIQEIIKEYKASYLFDVCERCALIVYTKDIPAPAVYTLEGVKEDVV